MSNQPRKRELIILSPGHGGVDTGATATVNGPYGIVQEVTEADLNLLFCRQLADQLSPYADVMILRQYDTTLTITERVAIVNLLKPHHGIAIHCNNFNKKQPEGIEVFTSPGHTPSDVLAGSQITHFEKEIPETRIRADWSDGDADKEAEFQILTDTTCPFTLPELGFMSNPSERQRLLNPEHQNKITTALMRASLDFMGIKETRRPLL